MLKATAKDPSKVKSSQYLPDSSITLVEDQRKNLVEKMKANGDDPSGYDFVENPIVNEVKAATAAVAPVVSSTSTNTSTVLKTMEEVKNTATNVAQGVTTAKPTEVVTKLAPDPITLPTQTTVSYKPLAEFGSHIGMTTTDRRQLIFQMTQIYNTSHQWGMSATASGKHVRSMINKCIPATELEGDIRIFFQNLIPSRHFNAYPGAIVHNAGARCAMLGTGAAYEMITDILGNRPNWIDPDMYNTINRGLGNTLAAKINTLQGGAANPMPLGFLITAISQRIPVDMYGYNVRIKSASKYAERCFQSISLMLAESIANVYNQQAANNRALATSDVLLNEIYQTYFNNLRFTAANASTTEWRVDFEHTRTEGILNSLNNVLGVWLRSTGNIDNPTPLHPVAIRVTAWPRQVGGPIAGPQAFNPFNQVQIVGYQGPSSFYNDHGTPFPDKVPQEYWKYHRIVNEHMTFLTQIEFLVDQFFANAVPYGRRVHLEWRQCAEIALAELSIRDQTPSSTPNNSILGILADGSELAMKLFGNRSNDHSIARLINSPDIRVSAYGLVKLALSVLACGLMMYFARYANENKLVTTMENKWEQGAVSIAFTMDQEMKTLHCGLKRDPAIINTPIADRQFIWPQVPPYSHIVNVEFTRMRPQGTMMFQTQDDLGTQYAALSQEALADEKVPSIQANTDNLLDGMPLVWKIYNDKINLLKQINVDYPSRLLIQGIHADKYSVQTWRMSGNRNTGPMWQLVEEFWRDTDPMTAYVLSQDTIYYGHCGILETILENALWNTVTKCPDYFLIGFYMPPIVLRLDQDLVGTGHSPFYDGRVWLRDVLPDRRVLALRTFYPRSLFTDRERFLA